MAGDSMRGSRGRPLLVVLLICALVAGVVFAGLAWQQSQDAATTESKTRQTVHDEQRLAKRLKALNTATAQAQQQFSVVQSDVNALAFVDDPAIGEWNGWVSSYDSFLDLSNRLSADAFRPSSAVRPQLEPLLSTTAEHARAFKTAVAAFSAAQAKIRAHAKAAGKR